LADAGAACQIFGEGHGAGDNPLVLIPTTEEEGEDYVEIRSNRGLFHRTGQQNHLYCEGHAAEEVCARERGEARGRLQLRMIKREVSV